MSDQLEQQVREWLCESLDSYFKAGNPGVSMTKWDAKYLADRIRALLDDRAEGARADALREAAQHFPYMGGVGGVCNCGMQLTEGKRNPDIIWQEHVYKLAEARK